MSVSNRSKILCCARQVSSVGIVFLLILSTFSSLHAQETEWVSFTLKRVNLRQTASIRSTVLTVIDEGMRIHVFDEIPQWMHIYIDTGDSGWVSSDYVAPLPALERLPEVRSVLSQSRPIPRIAEQETPEETGAEFSVEKEPEIINPTEDDAGEGSFFEGFFVFLFTISVLANLWLAFRNRSLQKASIVLTKPSELQKEYQLLKKTNLDLKNQIGFMQERYAQIEKTVAKKDKDLQLQKDLHLQDYTDLKNKLNGLETTHGGCTQTIKSKDGQIEKLIRDNNNLHKEVETIHQKLNKSMESIQRQAVKLTLAEQTHKEGLLLKENEIERLQQQRDKTEREKQQIKTESEEKTNALTRDNQSLINKMNDLEKQISIKDKSLNERIAKAKKDTELVFRKQFDERLENERILLEKNYTEKLEDFGNRTQKEKKSLQDHNRVLREKLTEIEGKYDDEKKLRQELETSAAALTEKDKSEKAILEDLQKEYNSLLSIYEETQQKLKDAESAKIAGQEVYEKAALPVEADDAEISIQEPEPEPADSAIDISEVEKEVKPVPAENDFLGTYASNFFKKISKL